MRRIADRLALDLRALTLRAVAVAACCTPCEATIQDGDTPARPPVPRPEVVLTQGEGERSTRALREALGSRDREVRWEAATRLALEREDDGRVVDAIGEALDVLVRAGGHGPSDSASRVLDTLVLVPEASVGEQLLPRLERLAAGDTPASAKALRALGRFGGAQQAGTVVGALRGAKPDRREQALTALRAIAERESVRVDDEAFERLLLFGATPSGRDETLVTLETLELTHEQRRRLFDVASIAESGGPAEAPARVGVVEHAYAFRAEPEHFRRVAASPDVLWRVADTADVDVELLEAFDHRLRDEFWTTPTLLVHRHPATGEVTVPECRPDFLRAFGARTRSPALEQLAPELAESNRRFVRYSGGNSSGEDLSQLAEDYDRITGGLLGDVDAEGDGDDAEPLLAMVRLLLERAHSVEEAYYHGQGPLGLETLGAIQDAMRSVVAIVEVDEDGAGTELLGTGFVYGGRIVTASHLFTGERFWDEERFAGDSVRIEFVTDDARFAEEGARLVSADCGFWPEWDLACLRVAPEDRDELVAARLDQEALELGDAEGLAKGLVCGLAALELEGREGPVPTWIPSGRIIFPEQVLRPAEGMDPALAEAFELFGRALRLHLFGSCSPCSDEDLVDAMRQVEEAYDLRRDELGDRYFLRRAAKSPLLLLHLAKDPTFADHKKIRYFGTDLGTKPGASGSPVLRLDRDGPVLIGMHVTGISDAGVGVSTPPNLDRFGRAIPFPRVAPILDEFIGSAR